MQHRVGHASYCGLIPAARTMRAPRATTEDDGARQLKATGEQDKETPDGFLRVMVNATKFHHVSLLIQTRCTLYPVDCQQHMADSRKKFVTAKAAAGGDVTIDRVALNCAPALSNDHRTLYYAVNTGSFSAGYLVSVDSRTLAPIARVRLKDPLSGSDGLLSSDGTSSPTVGPDGDVYFGVLENPLFSNRFRGWLLHYDSTLTQTKTPGGFGWDDTASVVPAKLVPSYSGTSAYLLLTKYNNYSSTGGDGVNKLAILDPNVAAADPVTGAMVMKEILTVAGLTPDPVLPAVREWCINTAAIDPFTKSALVNSEDGKLYRWDFATNTLIQPVILTPGIGEAYTPTLVGVDGTVYAINNAILFAVGN